MKILTKPKLFHAYGGVASHFGRRRYSDTESALNEYVANALDWEATSIDVLIDPSNDVIEIRDNGIGMDESTLIDSFFSYANTEVKGKNRDRRGFMDVGAKSSEGIGRHMEVETYMAGEKKGILAQIDWDKVRGGRLGDIEPDVWKYVPSDSKYHGTTIRIKGLIDGSISPISFYDYLAKKHWPLLIEPTLSISIKVNGRRVVGEFPKYEEKIDFDSRKDFTFDGKTVKAPLDPYFGYVYGTVYVSDKYTPKDTGVSVYVKSQLIESYSKKDWLNWLNWGSMNGFKSRTKIVLFVKAENSTGGKFDSKALMLISDRNQFNESMKSFQELKRYLGAKGKTEHYPDGGVLKLIHTWVIRKFNIEKGDGQDEKSAASLKRINSKLINVFKDEPIALIGEKSLKDIDKSLKKIADSIRKKDGDDQEKYELKNRMFTCPKCSETNKIPIQICQKWEEMDAVGRMMFLGARCKSCGHQLDLEKDKFVQKHDIKDRGKLIDKLKLKCGEINIKVDFLGHQSPKAEYDSAKRIVTINKDHGLFADAYRTSDDCMDFHQFDCCLTAIAKETAPLQGKTFDEYYNFLCFKDNEPIDEEITEI